MRRVTTSRIIWARILIGLQIFSLNPAAPWLSAAEPSARFSGIRPLSNGRSSAPSVPRPDVRSIAAPAAPAYAAALGGFSPSPCDYPANAIVAENCLPGNPASQWDVSGAGDPNLQGFATDISVNRGQTVSFKVKTSTAYRLDIYRMGYYGGMGARKVATVLPSATLSRPACLPHRCDHRPRRLRQLGGVGLVGGARDRAVGNLFRQGCSRSLAAGGPENCQPHLLRCA